MDVILEPYDLQCHDAEVVASLIYQADPQLMELGFGPQDRATRILVRLMGLKNNQYAAENISCAQLEGRTVGVIVGFTGRQKQVYDKASGHDYFAAFGIWHMLSLLPRAAKLERMVTQDIAEDEYCIYGLSVAANCRNRGIGSLLLSQALREHERVCLDVNIANAAALRFYQRHGLRPDGENCVVYRRRRIGNICMRTHPRSQAKG